MSDISLPMPAAGIPAPAPAATFGARKSWAVPSILAWGTLAIVALMSIWLADEASLWMGRGHLPQMILLLPFGHLAGLAVVIAALRSEGRGIREYLGLTRLRGRTIGFGILWGIVGYIVLVAGLIGGALALQAIGYTHPGPGGGSLSQSKLVTLIAVWMTMVIAAPIVEEFMFRGLLYRGLAESRLGTFGALIVTSVVFGIVHYPGFGWARVIGTGLVGLLLGLLRWRTGGTSMSIVAHMMLNVIAASLLTIGVLMAP